MNSNQNKNNAKTFAVQTSLADIASLKHSTEKKWKKNFIKLAEKTIGKITGLPIRINTSQEQIVLNAAAIFWYQDSETKKFIMLKSENSRNEEIIQQFPFVACLNKESISATLETATKDLFGSAFIKSLPVDCFASDKIASAPTVVISDDNDKVQTILHNHVWINQITPEQAELIQNYSDDFSIASIPEYDLTGPDVHEVHKFLYHSCIRHIHKAKFNTMDSNFAESIEEFIPAHLNNQEKVLH